MNERIKELKLQAMRFAQEKCGGRPTDMHGNLRSDIWTEKFAELIVRECAQVCVEVGDANSDIYPEFGNGAYFSANRVKEHFGVEE